MRTNIRKIKTRRKFSKEFKLTLVSEFEKGLHSVLELSKLHSLAEQTIYNWIYKYSNANQKEYRIIEMSESSDQKVKNLEARIKELERVVGVKQIQLDYWEKLAEMAKQEYGMDIKKNSDTPQSAGLKNTLKR